jgi:DNA-binding SARP family transcriptional activator
VADEAVADEAVADEAVADEAVADEAVADEAVADEPVADEPVADEPVAEEPVAEEPVAEEPVAEEPVAEEVPRPKPVDAEEPEATAAPMPAPTAELQPERRVGRREADADRPLRVEVLGPYRISAFGELVSTGLRERARTLLAWYVLRPGGAPIEEAVEALWPGTPSEKVLKRFWYALGDLRSYLHRGEVALEALERAGDRYRPKAAEISCDLWDFRAALDEASRAPDDDAARALRAAVDAYSGDLLAGSDLGWAGPVRQDLHRRAVDAHLRLAELEDAAGRAEAAAHALNRAIDLDRYAEEPYRRLMALHAAHGRPDAATATWQLLQRRLADLDVDDDEATGHLYRTITRDARKGPGPRAGEVPAARNGKRPPRRGKSTT